MLGDEEDTVLIIILDLPELVKAGACWLSRESRSRCNFKIALLSELRVEGLAAGAGSLWFNDT